MPFCAIARGVARPRAQERVASLPSLWHFVQARLAPGARAGAVTSLAVSKAHENLLYAASGPAVLLFDLRMPAVAHPLMIMVQEKATSVQPLWEHDISQISMHPSGEHLAAVDEGGSVSIIDLRHRANDPPRVTRLQTKHGALASSVRWRGGSVDTPDFRTHLFSAGFDMKVMLHRLNNELQDQAEKPVALYTHAHTSQPLPGRGTRGQRKKKNRNASGQGADAGDVLGLDQSGGLPMVNPPFVHAIDVTADGQTLAAACGDGALRTYAFEDPGSVKDLSERVWQRHRRSVTCVSFLPGSTRFPCLKLVTGSDDRRVILWNLEEPETRSEHPSEDSLILDIDHGLKPNWLHCRAIGCSAPGPHLFVSDTSNVISAYSFRS